MATQFWAEAAWTGKWRHYQKEASWRQIQEVQTWNQVRGLAGAVCVKPVTWVLNGRTGTHWSSVTRQKIDIRHVCPRDVKKMLVQSPISVLEEVGSKVRA